MIALILTPIYVLINIYMLWRLNKWLKTINKREWAKHFRRVLASVFIFMGLTLILGFLIPDGNIAFFFKRAGYLWSAVQIFSLVVLGAAELCIFIVKRCGERGRRIAANERIGMCVGYFALALIITLSVWGTINAGIFRTTKYSVTIEKDGGRLENLRAVMISDIHLGLNFDTARLERAVNQINEQNPDIIFIAGDIFDNSYATIDSPQEMIKLFKILKSKYGVYACYGNHDIDEKILAGFTFGAKKPKTSSPEMDKFLKEAGIVLLKDEYVLIDDSFYVYGRPDASVPGSGITVRKTAEEATEVLDKSKPIIMLDHQPSQLEEKAAAGVDLDLCGHSHGGQFFPGNLIIDFFWDNARGYKKIGDMNNIVSSGIGTFGPNVRLGAKATAEICVIDIHFENN